MLYICSLQASCLDAFYLLMVLILITIFGPFLPIHIKVGWFLYFMCRANTKVKFITTLNKKGLWSLKGTSPVTRILHLLVSTDMLQRQTQHTSNILQDFLAVSFCLFVTTIVTTNSFVPQQCCRETGSEAAPLLVWQNM